MSMIRTQHIYWDLKDRPVNPGERKAKLAGKALKRLGIIGFFELTSKKYVAEHLRVDIKRTHIEKIDSRRLKSPDGCIKIDPEILTFQEITIKQQDPTNKLPNVGKLCDAKWVELMTKAESSKLRTGPRPWNVAKQSLIIELTRDEPDVTPTLQRLRLI